MCLYYLVKFADENRTSNFRNPEFVLQSSITEIRTTQHTSTEHYLQVSNTTHSKHAIGYLLFIIRELMFWVRTPYNVHTLPPRLQVEVFACRQVQCTACIRGTFSCSKMSFAQATRLSKVNAWRFV